MAETIDPVAYQASLDRLGGIFTSMMETVAELSVSRCPYRDRLDRCTALFGCRNQLKATDQTQSKICSGDDRLNYRSAWDTG